MASEWQTVVTILERIESKLVEHDRRFDAVDARFDRNEESVRYQGVLHERLESKVDAVIEALGTKASTSDVEKLRAEIVPRLDVLESALRARH